MNDTGIDEKKFSLLYGKNLFSAGDVIQVFYGHDDLDGSMPVIGIDLKIGIVMQLKSLNVFVEHSFSDAV